MSRGRFISLEGGEGCGKSTQVRLLAEWLESVGYRVHRTREPGGTPISEQLRELLLHPQWAPLAPSTELLLFGAARSQLVMEVIEPWLAGGGWVIADRFCDSTTVYQAYARGLQRQYVDAVNALAVQDCWPDRTLFLDIPVELGLERAHAQQEFASLDSGDRIEREAASFHEAVREGYHALAEAQPERLRTVDASGTINEVQAACRAALADWVRET